MPARTAKRTGTSSRARATRTSSARTTTSTRKKATPRQGLSRPVTPDDELAAVVGSRPLPRTQVVKKLWDYVKAEGLQDSKNRRMINADAKLKPLFGGKKKVSMFEVSKLIAEHVS
jgi:chromatin remodeling complex protein RSC6